MSEALSLSAPPFDLLTPAERDRLAGLVDVAFFPENAAVVRGQEAGDELFVVRSGLVQEVQGSEVTAAYGPGDAFDVKALFVAADSRAGFIARTDTVCQIVPRSAFLDLVRDNPAFGAHFHQIMTAALREVAMRQTNRELASFMMARIRQARLHPPVYVDAACPVRTAAAEMRDRKALSLLVRESRPDGDRIGIVTDRDLREAVILGDHPKEGPIGPLATWDLVTLQSDDFLFNALIVMTRKAIRRIVVYDGPTLAGVLEQVDLLGFLANHSHVVAIRIERAESIEELGAASADLAGLIQALHGNGVKVQAIAEIVTQLNRRIFRRLFELLAPPELLANSCLIVMGSEGRGEQILKTDQDNGLILRDGFPLDGLEGLMQRFSATLIGFGYPECPGRIMVNNPEWARPLAGYKEVLHGWMHRPDEAAQMNLAIFFDAAAVAGDATLLDKARAYLLGRLGDNAGFFAHFARPTLSFDTPLGLFSSLKGEQLDIKKGGIFPLVHGVRSLALEKHLTETNTLDRIWALSSLGMIERGMATELAEALLVMLGLRLKLKLGSGALQRLGTQTDNFIRPDELTRMERDLLKDALTVVKRFKEFVTYHFHLKMF